MTRDFTFQIYEHLLKAALNNGYTLKSYEDYSIDGPSYDKTLILRHDVDQRPSNSLAKALIEKELNVKATYYFRIVRSSFNLEIIKKIADLGHEIGYHYEDLTLCRGDFDQAIELFEKNLDKLRELYPIKTICMHGSPLSKWDNKLIWNEFDYEDYGILAEPYFDLDFNEVFYLTDTGMKWNASHFSVRDKVKSNYSFNFNSTFDIIRAINKGELPKKVMVNTHPQRWSDKFAEWVVEYIVQSSKNVAKKQLIKKRDSTRRF